MPDVWGCSKLLGEAPGGGDSRPRGASGPRLMLLCSSHQGACKGGVRPQSEPGSRERKAFGPGPRLLLPRRGWPGGLKGGCPAEMLCLSCLSEQCSSSWSAWVRATCCRLLSWPRHKLPTSVVSCRAAHHHHACRAQQGASVATHHTVSPRISDGQMVTHVDSAATGRQRQCKVCICSRPPRAIAS